MKVLFIFPPGRGFRIADKKTFPINPYSPPLGILYLSTILERNGHEIDVLDLTAENIDENKLKTKISWADAVGMAICTSSLNESRKLGEFIRNCDNEKPFLIGGPHCALDPVQALKDFNADICVKWEGEQSILDIIDALEGKKNLSKIPGICYKKNGSIKKNLQLDVNKNLDALSFPARHFIEKYEYGFILGEKLTNGKTTAIITTRGCPFNCRFCGYNAIDPVYRERSVENVIEEFKEIVKMGYKTVIIVDNNFLANKKRVGKIMDKIIENGFDLDIWIMAARVDSAEKGLYEKMRDAGVKFISFGIESANQEILDFYDKKTTVEQIRYAINLSNEMGFITSGSFIFGAPIETKQHIENTIKFAKDVPLDVAHFLTLGYYRGSPLWEEAVNTGKLRSDEYIIDADAARGLGNLTKAELNNYCIQAHKSFYLNPKHIKRQMIKVLKTGDFRFFKAGLRMFLIKEN